MPAEVFSRDVWDKAAESVRQTIVALDLPGIDADSIQIRDPVDGDNVELGISIHWVTEQVRSYSNVRDKVGYGIGVTDIVEKSRGRLEGLSQQSARRSVMRRSRMHQRLPNVSLPGGNQLHCTLEPHSVKLPKGNNNYRAHSFVIRFWMIEPRT